MEEAEVATVKRYTIRVPNEIASAIQMLADIEGKSVNQVVVEAMADRVAGSREDPEARARVEEQIRVLREQYGL